MNDFPGMKYGNAVIYCLNVSVAVVWYESALPNEPADTVGKEKVSSKEKNLWIPFPNPSH